MRRALLTAGLLVGLLIVGGFTSYHRARRVADAFVGPLPPGVAQFRHGLVPLRLAPAAERVGWVIAYGPRAQPGHIGFEVFVAPLGGVLATNPTDLPERLRAWRSGEARSRPAT